MNDSKSLIRQWRLLKFLADARVGYTIKELSAEMAASVETIRRDINDLGLAGFKIRENVGFRGLKRWRVEGFEESFGFSITDMLCRYSSGFRCASDLVGNLVQSEVTELLKRALAPMIPECRGAS